MNQHHNLVLQLVEATRLFQINWVMHTQTHNITEYLCVVKDYNLVVSRVKNHHSSEYSLFVNNIKLPSFGGDIVSLFVVVEELDHRQSNEKAQEQLCQTLINFVK